MVSWGEGCRSGERGIGKRWGGEMLMVEGRKKKDSGRGGGKGRKLAPSGARQTPETVTYEAEVLVGRASDPGKENEVLVLRAVLVLDCSKIE